MDSVFVKHDLCQKHILLFRVRKKKTNRTKAALRKLHVVKTGKHLYNILY